MLEVGAELFRRQGYHATTLVEVVAAGGLPRGSIYHHFPEGKQQLAIEAVAVAAREVTADMVRAMEQVQRPADAIAAYVTLIADRLEASGFQDGCWYATTALEVTPTDTVLADALNQQFEDWEGLIASALEGFDTTADEALRLARFLIATIEGGLLLARVARDTGPMRDLIPYLQQIVDPD